MVRSKFLSAAALPTATTRKTFLKSRSGIGSVYGLRSIYRSGCFSLGANYRPVKRCTTPTFVRRIGAVLTQEKQYGMVNGKFLSHLPLCFLGVRCFNICG